MHMALDSSSRFSVIGYGSWATTLVGQLLGKGNRVNWLILNPEVSDCVVNEGYNPKYVPDLELDKSLLEVSADVNQVVSKGDIILLAAPSAYLKKSLEGLNCSLEGKFFLSAIKGIVPDECITVLDFIRDRYGVSQERLGLISGPTHAEEVSRGRLSFLTVACPSESDAALIASRIGSASLRVSVSADVRGIEFASILKNIYAIGAGIASGLGYGDNFIAVLAAASAGEMLSFLNGCFPYEGRDLSRCPYLGDLLVTCYSNYSRNRRLGVLIGRGCSVKSALNEMTMIAEGYFSAECMHRLEEREGIAAQPIANAVYRILYEGARPRKTFDYLAKNILK